MKSLPVALTSNLVLSVVMILAYGGMVATWVTLRPGAAAPAPGMTPHSSVPAQALAAPLPKVAAPGSLRLRMTLPYMPGGAPREADQEI